MQDQVIGGIVLGWNDYGARFYDPEIARWHTKEPFEELVPTISLYAYCYDNPTNFNEPTGRWPGWVHKRIMRKALNPYIGHGLRKEDIDLIIKGGAFVDATMQDAKFSPRHAMRNGANRQTVEEAQQAMEEWVNENIKDFLESGNYEKLGYALHAISDIDSPAHSRKPWSGESKMNPKSWWHLSIELNFGGRSLDFFASIARVGDVYKQIREMKEKYSYSLLESPAPTRSTDPAPTPLPPLPQPVPQPASRPPLYVLRPVL